MKKLLYGLLVSAVTLWWGNVSLAMEEIEAAGENLRTGRKEIQKQALATLMGVLQNTESSHRLEAANVMGEKGGEEKRKCLRKIAVDPRYTADYQLGAVDILIQDRASDLYNLRIDYTVSKKGKRKPFQPSMPDWKKQLVKNLLTMAKTEDNPLDMRVKAARISAINSRGVDNAEALDTLIDLASLAPAFVIPHILYLLPEEANHLPRHDLYAYLMKWHSQFGEPFILPSQQHIVEELFDHLKPRAEELYRNFEQDQDARESFLGDLVRIWIRAPQGQTLEDRKAIWDQQIQERLAQSGSPKSKRARF